MNLAPLTISELQAALAKANSHNEKIQTIDLSTLHRVLAHTPEDMTCTVEAGITLAALQKHLARHRQWLPIDPSRSDRLTIGQLLTNNESGPRRFGYGTIREHLLGVTVILADGRLIKSGGKVVKNVAGFDLCKLFVGSHGSLGVIVAATFKLQPLPEIETFMAFDCETLAQADQLIERIMNSELTPVILDLHNAPTLQLVIGFAGGRVNVEWQTAHASEMNARPQRDLAYHESFWNNDPAGPVHRLSILPSKVCEAITALGQVQFIAHAGAGQLWYRGGAGQKNAPPDTVMQRVKDAYDPAHILPEIPT